MDSSRTTAFLFLAVLFVSFETRAQPIGPTSEEITEVEEPIIVPVEATFTGDAADESDPSLTLEEPIMDGCVGDCGCPEGQTGIQPFCIDIEDETEDDDDSASPSPPAPEIASPAAPEIAPPAAPSQPPTVSYEVIPGFSPNSTSDSALLSLDTIETTAAPTTAAPTTAAPLTTTTPDFGGCPSAHPCFLSEEQHLKVVIGEDATFRCHVGNLGTHFVVWMKGDSLLTMGTMIYTKNRRISYIDESGSKNGSNPFYRSTLINTKIQPSDAKAFVCKINTYPEKSLVNKLEVLVPPSAGILPASELITVVEGDELLLECETGGNPEPDVTWAKEGALLPSGESILHGRDLPFPSLSRDDGGVYICTATNGVRNPATAKATIQVNFAPTVQTKTSMIRAREGGSMEISCSVEADPQPVIEWRRLGANSSDLVVNSNENQIRETNVGRNTQSTLRIAALSESDFGTYICSAENSLGVDDSSIQVSGLPERAVITSDANCIVDTECSVEFRVSSLNLVVSYHVRIREFNQTLGDYGNLTVIVVESSGDQIEGDDYKTQVLIPDLSPSTRYEVDVFAHTKYGAGPVSPPHYLTTNLEGATYPPPPTTTPPPTTIPPTTIPPTTEVATSPTTMAPVATIATSDAKDDGHSMIRSGSWFLPTIALMIALSS